MPTKLGRIIDFATDFVNENKAQRFYEWFTAGSIKQSETLPTEGILTECGKVIYVSKEQQKVAYMDIITYTMTNTFWWVPLLPAQPGQPKTWAIQYVNNKQYKDLDIKTYLPDGFDMDVAAPIRIVSNGYLINEPFGFVFRHCLTPYQQLYSLSYPLVFRIKDALSTHFFQFAILVNMNKMEPGNCAGAAIADVCKDLNCYANITVVHDSDPVAGAVIDYQGCIAGSTDSKGNLIAPIKCGTGKLEIFAIGYEPFNVTVSATAINNTYSLSKVATTMLYLKKVGVNSGCSLPNIDVAKDLVSLTFEHESDSSSTSYSNREFSDSCIQDCLNRFSDASMSDQTNECLRSCLGNSYSDSITAELPEGNYKITGTMKNAETGNYTGGFIIDNFRISSTDTELSVFIPMLAFEQPKITDEDLIQLTDKLKKPSPEGGCGFENGPVQRSR
jgi:hypothetical protein